MIISASDYEKVGEECKLIMDRMNELVVFARLRDYTQSVDRMIKLQTKIDELRNGQP